MRSRMPLLSSGGLEASNGENGNTISKSTAEDGLDVLVHESPIPSHPLGIKPLGNQYLSPGCGRARDCLGALQALPDEVLMTLLESLDQAALQLLGRCCKFLFAFCSSEELWKAVFLEYVLEDIHRRSPLKLPHPLPRR